MSSSITGAPSRPISLHHDRIRKHLVDNRLQKDQQRLFIHDPSQQVVKFWESHLGAQIHRITDQIQELASHEKRDTDALKAHLNKNMGDGEEGHPIVRHVFLTAGNSEEPLNCTLDSFSALSAHHRLSAEFKDMLLSFGKPVGKLVNYHKPRCHLEIRQLSRPSQALVAGESSSHWEMRNSYKLSAMELSGDSWVMRQMAVHHSIDLSSGKSFTMTVKASHKEIANRLKSLPVGGQKVPSTIPDCFTASLETQLLGFAWCVEGWTDYIDSIEQQIRTKSDEVAAIPIQQEQEATVRQLTGFGDASNEKGLQEKGGMSNSNNEEKAAVSIRSCVRSWIMSFFPEDDDDDDDVAAAADPAAVGAAQVGNGVAGTEKEDKGMRRNLGRATARQIETLKAIQFEGLQSIQNNSTKLREAKFVMDLNRQALSDVREHYKAAFDSDEIPQEIKKSCAMAHRGFQQRIKHFENLLAMECMRIDTLTQVAGDGNGLYDSILQLQAGQISQLFAMDAHAATVRMEQMTKDMQGIARNTEKDTASMHVITFFALVFLPGTFLGVRYYCRSLLQRESLPSLLTDSQSFFSTPIFDGKVEDGSSAWGFNGTLFALFAEICFPMMAVTLILWGLWTYRVKRRSQQRIRAKGDEMC